jgi:choline kinase
MGNTLAVVIAAGMGVRLQPLTDDLPKCMLEVQGATMLHRALRTFSNLDLPRSVVIGGYCAQHLILPEQATLVMNHDYRNNNILHSLAFARKSMAGEGTVLISYSDIIFRQSIVEKFLADDNSDISIVVDQEWATRYKGRELHPLGQAEAVRFGEQGHLIQTGKDLLTEDKDPNVWGEFIGMMKMTPNGREDFWGVFDDVNSKLALDDSYHGAPQWRRAYITDHLQELVDRGIKVHCTFIQGGWLEIDTTEDYEMAASFKF